MRNFLFATIVFFAFSMCASSQQKFEWEQYGLSFQVPSNFNITENTATSFDAGNGNINLTIEVLDYTGISAETIGTALGELAVQTGMKNADIGGLALTTLAGAYAEGTVDGANLILVALLDTDSNIALLASIVYADGYEKQATNICNSFAIR